MTQTYRKAKAEETKLIDLDLCTRENVERIHNKILKQVQAILEVTIGKVCYSTTLLLTYFLKKASQNILIATPSHFPTLTQIQN